MVLSCALYTSLFTTRKYSISCVLFSDNIIQTITKWRNDTRIISNDKLYSLGNMTNYLKGNKTYDISNSTMNDLYSGLKNYETTKNENYKYMERGTNILYALNWTLISIYWAIMVITFYAFFKRKAKLILFFSFLVLFSLPFINILNGFYTAFFFEIGDFCESIYNAIYLAYFFPVENVSVGNFISCFDGVKLY